MKKALRVLIVEDREEDAILLLRELKQSYAPEFERVASAGELQRALGKRWDVIISDYSMPGFNGIEALQIVLGANLDIPFIIVSGAIGEEIAVNAMTNGASDYLMKGNLARLVPAVERELREAESRRERRRGEADLYHLAAIVESSADAIVGMDLDGTIRSWNLGAEKIYGYAAAEAIGRPTAMIAPPVSSGEISHILERIRKGERVDRYETIRVRKDGTPIDVSLTISPIKNSLGETIGVSAIERDITARKKTEAERNRLIEELKQALTKVNDLSGLLPICASCKKIRDDQGDWQQVETFIKARSCADFSHGMCPDCMSQWYPEYMPAVKASAGE
ncbi:MAG: PAS domain S-box protein [Verrucomicrobiota bacterium]